MDAVCRWAVWNKDGHTLAMSAKAGCDADNLPNGYTVSLDRVEGDVPLLVARPITYTCVSAAESTDKTSFVAGAGLGIMGACIVFMIILSLYQAARRIILS